MSAEPDRETPSAIRAAIPRFGKNLMGPSFVWRSFAARWEESDLRIRIVTIFGRGSQRYLFIDV
jgi:hypothetical protein